MASDKHTPSKRLKSWHRHAVKAVTGGERESLRAFARSIAVAPLATFDTVNRWLANKKTA
jgi:hypothetical protein